MASGAAATYTYLGGRFICNLRIRSAIVIFFAQVQFFGAQGMALDPAHRGVGQRHGGLNAPQPSLTWFQFHASSEFGFNKKSGFQKALFCLKMVPPISTQNGDIFLLFRLVRHRASRPPFDGQCARWTVHLPPTAARSCSPLRLLLRLHLYQ